MHVFRIFDAGYKQCPCFERKYAGLSASRVQSVTRLFASGKQRLTALNRKNTLGITGDFYPVAQEGDLFSAQLVKVNGKRKFGSGDSKRLQSGLKTSFRIIDEKAGAEAIRALPPVLQRSFRNWGSVPEKPMSLASNCTKD